jgi:hypothetical protein
LLRFREGKKQFPKGFVAALAAKTGVHELELRRRVALAERYPTRDEVCHAVINFPTWHAMVKGGLRQEREPRPALEVDRQARAIDRAIKALRGVATLDFSELPLEAARALADEAYAITTEYERVAKKAARVG